MKKYVLSTLMIASVALSGCSTLKGAFSSHKEKKATCKFASLELTAEDLKDCGFEIPLNQDYLPAGTLERLSA